MKSLLWIVGVMVFSGCAPIPVKEIPPRESVIEMPGLSKDQIYAATKIWIAETFRSAKAVTQDDDKEAGRIIGNGRINYPCGGSACLGLAVWTLDFTLRVDVKDEKMRIIFTNMSVGIPSPGGISGPAPEGQMEYILRAQDKMCEELRAAIEKGKSASNW